jgi:threonine aldolase
MADRLDKKLRRIAKVVYPRQANSVFVALPMPACRQLWKKGWRFYNDVGPDNAARFMCSWDTTPEDVEALVKDIETATN